MILCNNNKCRMNKWSWEWKNILFSACHPPLHPGPLFPCPPVCHWLQETMKGEAWQILPCWTWADASGGAPDRFENYIFCIYKIYIHNSNWNIKQTTETKINKDSGSHTCCVFSRFCVRFLCQANSSNEVPVQLYFSYRGPVSFCF